MHDIRVSVNIEKVSYSHNNFDNRSNMHIPMEIYIDGSRDEIQSLADYVGESIGQNYKAISVLKKIISIHESEKEKADKINELQELRLAKIKAVKEQEAAIDYCEKTKIALFDKVRSLDKEHGKRKDFLRALTYEISVINDELIKEVSQ